MNSNIMISHNWSVALNDIYELIDAQKQQSIHLGEQNVLLEFQLELRKLKELTRKLDIDRSSMSSRTKVEYFNRRILLLKRQVSDIYSVNTWTKTIVVLAIEAEITQLLSRIVIEIEENSRP